MVCVRIFAHFQVHINSLKCTIPSLLSFELRVTLVILAALIVYGMSLPSPLSTPFLLLHVSHVVSLRQQKPSL